MHQSEVLVFKGHEVDSLLTGCEMEIIGVVKAAYEAHGKGQTSLPHSAFLRFPDDDRSRIIALPAYLGADFGVAGVKWVSSFPANVPRGWERASATVILNSTATGHPLAILEGSIISAKRTAASAALAAECLHSWQEPFDVGIIGCGLINFEMVRFLLALGGRLRSFILLDLDPHRESKFKAKCRATFGDVEFESAREVSELCCRASLICIATTALEPYIDDLSICSPNTTILHISLRDLRPEVIQSCDNVVDDVDHVCRAQTSIHLTEQLLGHRDFIRCTLSDILLGRSPVKKDTAGFTVFSPFGLGILDLAVSKFVLDRGREQKQGLLLNSFLPEPWTERM